MALSPRARQSRRIRGEAVPPPTRAWLPSLGQPLNTALPLRPSGERVFQRQLRAGEQPQALPVLTVCAVRGGRARPQPVRGQQPGEVLRLQRCLQVLRGGRRLGLGPGTQAGTLQPTPALASCVAGAWLRMQGTSPSSSTRPSLTTQTVREGDSGRGGADSGEGLFPNTI